MSGIRAQAATGVLGWLLCFPLLWLPGSAAAQTSALTLEHGQLTVMYRDARDAQQLPAVVQAWEQAAAHLRVLGRAAPAVRIEAARSAADFTARTGESSAVAAITRGHTILTQRLGALAGRGLLSLTVQHEVFHTAQPPAWPRWLAEGLARIFSGEAQRDPPSRTLSGVSELELDRLLLERDSGRVAAAYREASRRAGMIIRRVGWTGIWTWTN